MTTRPWRWLTTGSVGRGEAPITASELVAFRVERRRLELPRVRRLVLLLLAFNFVFWATDGLLLGHLPEAPGALGQGRLTLSLWGAAIFAASWLPPSLLVAAGWLSFSGLGAIVGWTLGHLGGPDTPWLHHGYPFLFLGLVVWISPLHRLAVVTTVSALMCLAYFWPHPGHLDDLLAGSAIANLAYVAGLSAALGIWIDALRLRVYRLDQERARHREELAERVEEQTRHIQALLDHVEAGREAERGALAADLHDEMGQALTGTRLLLQAARRRAEAGADAGPELRQLGLALQHATQSLRQVLARLQPRVLEDLGLGAAAEWLGETLVEPAGLGYSIIAPAELERVCPASALVVFRVLQEALTNVVRHADATRVDVRIALEGDELLLRVEDDGIGLCGAPGSSGGMGVLGMSERARARGGRLTIASTPAKGTAVRLQLPLDAPA